MPYLTDKPNNSTSIGIRLYAGWAEKLEDITKSALPTEIYNLQEVPDLSQSGGDKDDIEITVLTDTHHEYADGLENYADDDELSFTFLYTSKEYKDLNTLIKSEEDGKSLFWFVRLPDSCYFTIKSKSAKTVFNGVGVASALTYTLNLIPSGEIGYVYKEDAGNIFVTTEP